MSPDDNILRLLDTYRARPRQAAEPDWLSEGRDAAMRRFGQLGLPTPRDEAWRFSDPRPLRAAMGATEEAASAPVTAATLAPYRFEGAGHRLVFVDGRFAPDLSDIGALPPGAVLSTLWDSLAHRPGLAVVGLSATDSSGGRPLAALNAATFTDGLVLALAPGVELADPVELVQYRTESGGPPAQLRHVVLIGEGSSATLVESAIGAGAGCTNAVMAVAVSEGGKLTHVKLQAEPDEAVHLAETRATLGRDATFDAFFLVLGARLSRQEAEIALAGTGARLSLNGSYVLHGHQEATLVPFVDHQVADCETRELFKGVLQDAAHGVFLGTITVREGADQTEAHQQNHNLLTSATARVDTRPELTIHADEVKCSHGATVGDLDEAALFYLQARGLDPATARRILIGAFATDAIDRAALPPLVGDWLRHHLAAKLGTGGDVP